MAILVNRLTWATLTHLQNSNCLSYSAIPFGYSFNGTPAPKALAATAPLRSLRSRETPSLEQTEADLEPLQIC